MIDRVFKAFDKVLSFFEDWTLYIATMVALISLFINVVLRYGFKYSLAWSEELVREVIIYTTLIGCSAAIKNRSMIKIDALIQLAPRLKTALFFWSHLVTLFFSCFMMYYGALMVKQQAMTSQKTIILEIPLVYLYCVLPLMGGMMFIRTLQNIWLDYKENRRDR